MGTRSSSFRALSRKAVVVSVGILAGTATALYRARTSDVAAHASKLPSTLCQLARGADTIVRARVRAWTGPKFLEVGGDPIAPFTNLHLERVETLRGTMTSDDVLIFGNVEETGESFEGPLGGPGEKDRMFFLRNIDGHQVVIANGILHRGGELFESASFREGLGFETIRRAVLDHPRGSRCEVGR